jgi:hypothetical protein
MPKKIAPGITTLPQFGTPGFNPPGDKPKPNLIMPVAPMFASIMEPRARSMVKQLCKIKNMQGHSDPCIDVVKEVAWNQGPGNENLEQRSLDIGTIGMVVAVAEPKTVLRFLVTTKEGNQDIDGIYHVSVMNLEPLETEE